jgi:hypothetical protein
VWRITEGGLSEDAPAWVVNRTLQITYNSWGKEGILRTWWAECEPKGMLDEQEIDMNCGIERTTRI